MIQSRPSGVCSADVEATIPTTRSKYPLLEALRCTFRVLADSERTGEIVVAEEIIAQSRLRALIEDGLFTKTEEGRDLIAEMPALIDTDLDALRELAPDTLGGAFVRFLDDHGLDYGLCAQPTPYTDGADAQFLLHRLRQSHDLWHTLTGLGTRGHEEVLIHAFSYGQTGIISSALIVALGGIKHMLFEKRWAAAYPGVSRALAAGKKAAPLLAVYWERHWDEPIASVRRRLRIDTLAS